MNTEQLLKVNEIALEYGLTRDQVEDIKKNFMMYDLDKDGVISAQEVTNVMNKCGSTPMSDEEVQQFIKDLDSQGTGSIQLWEFVRSIAKNKSHKHTIANTNYHGNKRRRIDEDHGFDDIENIDFNSSDSSNNNN
eukprot:TRINITY_DN100586_c0_g1_i1.p1 TRINITY_DN100586_c0_g1~~TRINITY_DN100586_c0_g1_i1.p1  ORF type:complete len:135 (+),score=13.15 TRINITY_DN100586_c0_g1_i1:49-453(+)